MRTTSWFYTHCHPSRRREAVSNQEQLALRRGGSAVRAHRLKSRSPAQQKRFAGCLTCLAAARGMTVFVSVAVVFQASIHVGTFLATRVPVLNLPALRSRRARSAS